MKLSYLKTDIRLAVANKRRMIMLMNRDRSFTWLSWLSSVSHSRSVNSWSRAVNASIVRDSARKV